MNAHEIALGIDQGLQRTGYTVVRRLGRSAQLIEGGVLRTEKGQSLAERLADIGQGLREVIDDYRPTAVAVEQSFAYDRNLRSSLLLAHVRGVILMTVAEKKLPVVQLAPTEVKRLLTGSGRASKEQIQDAIRTELSLEAVLEPHDVADASAIALCVLHRVRFAA